MKRGTAITALQDKLERLTLSEKLSLVAERLKEDHKRDEDLTAFTALDGESFYKKG